MNHLNNGLIISEIKAQLKRAKSQGRPHLEINAGELHRLLGGYPSHNHVMPSVCDAMYSLLGAEDEIVFAPKHQRGASLTIRYNVNVL